MGFVSLISRVLKRARLDAHACKTKKVGSFLRQCPISRALGVFRSVARGGRGDVVSVKRPSLTGYRPPRGPAAPHWIGIGYLHEADSVRLMIRHSPRRAVTLARPVCVDRRVLASGSQQWRVLPCQCAARTRASRHRGARLLELDCSRDWVSRFGVAFGQYLEQYPLRCDESGDGGLGRSAGFLWHFGCQ